jgi:hypothetical protein
VRVARSTSSWETLLGLAAAGCGVAGVSAWLSGLLAFFRGDGVGAGLSFLAAGISFGLLLQGLTRRDR